MKKNSIKKRLLTLFLSASLLTSFSVIAHAYQVTASIRMPQSATTNSYFTVRGDVYYDSAYGPLPVPSTCYFYLDVPWMPVKSVTLNGSQSSWSSGSFYYVSAVDTIAAVNNDCFRFTQSFSIFGSVTKTATATAQAESFTTNTYNGSAGTGKNHSTDSNAVAGFKVN